MSCTERASDADCISIFNLLVKGNVFETANSEEFSMI